MNMLDGNHKIASVLINRPLPGDKPEDDVNESAHELEIVKELLSAIKENKPEKAMKALMMIIKTCYDNYEEQEEKDSDETPDGY